MAREARRCCSDIAGQSFYPTPAMPGTCHNTAQNYVGSYAGWNGSRPVPICDRHAAAIRRAIREGLTDNRHRITRLRPGAPWPTAMDREAVRRPVRLVSVERDSPEWGIPAEA